MTERKKKITKILMNSETFSKNIRIISQTQQKQDTL